MMKKMKKNGEILIKSVVEYIFHIIISYERGWKRAPTPDPFLYAWSLGPQRPGKII